MVVDGHDARSKRCQSAHGRPGQRPRYRWAGPEAARKAGCGGGRSPAMWPGPASAPAVHTRAHSEKRLRAGFASYSRCDHRRSRNRRAPRPSNQALPARRSPRTTRPSPPAVVRSERGNVRAARSKRSDPVHAANLATKQNVPHDPHPRYGRHLVRGRHRKRAGSSIDAHRLPYQPVSKS